MPQDAESGGPEPEKTAKRSDLELVAFKKAMEEVNQFEASFFIGQSNALISRSSGYIYIYMYITHMYTYAWIYVYIYM